MATDRSTYVCVPSLGIDVLIAEFAHHVYDRHAHEVYVLGAIERGGVRSRYRGATVDIPQAHVMALEPEEAHDGAPRDRGGFRKSVLYVPPTVFAAHVGASPRRRFAGASLDDAAAAHLTAQVARRLVDAGPDLGVDTALTALLARLAARWMGTVAPERRIDRLGLDRVRAHLHEHVCENVRLAELAALTDLSRFQLGRAFGARFGLPPHAYLVRLRLERARALLARGEAPASVAAALGFADQSHLTRRFHGAYGVTPRQYAAAARTYKTAAGGSGTLGGWNVSTPRSRSRSAPTSRSGRS
jgi:AraC-like DNA-binding protein